MVYIDTVAKIISVYELIHTSRIADDVHNAVLNAKVAIAL
jgi:hypothetical protein